MSALTREKVVKEDAGKTCDGCGAEVLWAENWGVWIEVTLTNFSKTWDFCPACKPKLESVLPGLP